MQTVTIDFDEYVRLLDAELFLSMLEVNGVDNWEWHDEALDDYLTAIDTHPILMHTTFSERICG
jgi:hypothetical protein